SAVGLADLKPTPVHPSYPGSKLQATAISNILDSDFLKRAPGWFSYLVTLLFVLSTYFCLAYFDRATWKLGTPCALLLLYAVAALEAFRQGWGLPMAMPLGLGLCGLFEGLGYTIFVENAEKKKLVEAFSKYLSPAVTQELLGRGEDPRAEIGRQVN